MFKLLRRFFVSYQYSIASIKNRYPCKIIDINNFKDFTKKTQIRYQAGIKRNIRISEIQEILDDPMLIEKFHPTEGVKLGFLSCGEILLKKSTTLEEARKHYLTIIEKMFEKKSDL